MAEKTRTKEYLKPTLNELGSILDLTGGLFSDVDDAPTHGHNLPENNN